VRPAELPASLFLFFCAHLVAIEARSFIRSSTNKSQEMREVPEQPVSPFVVGAGNDAQ
jgi:hypothetical protein